MLRTRLGRVVVECRDLPAFAGNRIGFKVLNECAALAERYGVGFIDYLIGPYTGRAMPPLATIDLVGWDVHAAIVDNVYAKTSDEAHDVFALPQYMRDMIAAGYLGNKTPKLGGFYRRSKDGEGGKAEQPLIPSERAHAASSTAVQKLGFVEEIKQLHAIGCYRDGMAKFLDAKGTEADLARRVILGYVSYALNRVGSEEVVDHPRGVDDIMGYGFNWAPPSVLVALFGPERTVGAMRDLGLPVPAVIASLGKDESWLTRPLSNIGRYFVGK
jgi:hypothetical protein